MQVKSFRAKTLSGALALVRDKLGPDAAILGTREIRTGWLGGLIGGPKIEVMASSDLSPTRDTGRLMETMDSPQLNARVTQASCRWEELSPRCGCDDAAMSEATAGWASDEKAWDQSSGQPIPAAHQESFRVRFRETLEAGNRDHRGSFDELTTATEKSRLTTEMPESLFHLYTDLVEAEVCEVVAQDLLQVVRKRCSAVELTDRSVVRQRLQQYVESQLRIHGAIQVTPGQRKIVALVGPTGVGKTTTIAKLAANFRLKEKRRVGLITVDTYRIAAVDQLRTYADIIDLPMEVVSTPREMREAVSRLSHLDLILVDTAGRSPRDEVQLQELKSMLSEAEADEVHLVLSVVAGSTSLAKLARRFEDVGTTAILLTKLDEATGLGGLVPFLRDCELPISYVTDGQDVPQDIRVAESTDLAAQILESHR
ncbi:MAG: flagellar biosynthesis protein FlhF [Planctomycetales bacterium]|nr:flagellar biosynthesis protein FlhF [Planctomycetales bacterium]